MSSSDPTAHAPRAVRLVIEFHVSGPGTRRDDARFAAESAWHGALSLGDARCVVDGEDQTETFRAAWEVLDDD